MSAAVPLIVGAAVAVAAIVCATIAVTLGHIDAQTFAAIVSTFGGVGVGVGAHAAGTRA